MRLVSFYDWIRRIYATQEKELGCDELLEILPPYVDAEIAGTEPDGRSADVQHHLNQCPYCYDLYIALRDASCLEAQESLYQVATPERCPAGWQPADSLLSGDPAGASPGAG